MYGDAPSTRWFADFVIGVFDAASMREVVVRESWATEAEIDAMIAALDAWAERPDAFAAWLYCGALGWSAV